LEGNDKTETISVVKSALKKKKKEVLVNQEREVTRAAEFNRIQELQPGEGVTSVARTGTKNEK